MGDRLGQLLRQRRFLLADGGMGTGLFERGLAADACPELWTVDRPDRVADLHREFVAAGADIILTNSFGGNALRLERHGAAARVAELARAAARLARNVADDAPRPVLVAGSIGPSGERLAPLGPLEPRAAGAAFRAQAVALAEGGVDLLWIETLSSAEELAVAARAAGGLGLPVCATLSFDTDGRTMLGLTPEAALAAARDLAPPLAGFGANCGSGPAGLLATLLRFGRPAQHGPALVAKSNSGLPEWREGRLCHPASAATMAAYAVLARAAGARLIGGCCGTTGAHLAAMRRALDTTASGPPPTVARIARALGPLAAADIAALADPSPARPSRSR